MAGSIKLTDFKNAVQDVARPNRFFMSIVGDAQPVTNWTEDISYLCKSASLPSRTIGMIELNWQGMKAKVAGDPTFDSITLTFLQDYAWAAKNFFEAWLEIIANMATNERTAHADYKCQIQLEHIGRTDAEVLATYILDGAFPTSMDSIELSHDSSDTAEEFSITIEYDTFYRSDNSGISTTLD